MRLYAHRREEIEDLASWLDEHPDHIDPAIRLRVKSWLNGMVDQVAVFPTYPEIPESFQACLEGVIDDWVEVLSSHPGEEFYTFVIKPA